MGDDAFPPAVAVSLDETLQTYWLDRARQHLADTYAGVRISKFPEDLRTYEHLLWSSRANVVVELGSQLGGAALWFRDRLQTMARYRRITQPLVISIDISILEAQEALAVADPEYAEAIRLVEGDVRDPDLPDRVSRLMPPGACCMVIEDSAHTYDTTSAALKGFASFVPINGYFVVEDGCVDVEPMRLSGSWPRGVLPALDDWLLTAEGAQFVVKRDLELYGLSCHPSGFLQRIAAPN
jgi:cephalosporin hydroxylase